MGQGLRRKGSQEANHEKTDPNKNGVDFQVTERDRNLNSPQDRSVGKKNDQFNF